MNPGNLPPWGPGFAVLAALISIAFGLLNCFLGYRIFRFMLGVYGFLLGAALGAILAGAVAEGNIPVLVLAVLFCGLVGAALMVIFYFVGVFLVGAAAGALVANLIGTGLGFEMPLLVTILAAVVVGVLAVILQRAVIILATTFSGAWMAVGGGLFLITGREVPPLELLSQPAAWQRAGLPLLVTLILWLALGVAGAVVQFRTTEEDA